MLLDASGLPTYDTAFLRWFYSLHIRKGLNEVFTTNPDVARPELAVVQGQFKDWFRTKKGTSFEPLDHPEVEILWEDVDSICRNLIGTVGVIRGLVFHYGYDDATRSFKVGISRLPMTFNTKDQDYDYDTTKSKFYTVDSNGRLRQGLLSDWNANEKKNYFSFVNHRRAGPGNWQRVDTANDDVESYAVSYDMELKLLGEHNRDSLNKDTKLVVACIAEESKDASGHCFMRHHLALKLRNAANDLVDDKPHALLFQMRGADLGTPCPPRCKKFKFGDKSRNCP